MAFELGVYTFGNTPRTAAGGYGTTAEAIRDVLEAVHVAEEVGLDFFGFGEHHTRSMPVSSPTSLVNAAAASTHRIGLGTTVTVLSTDEPIRVFQQLSTAAAIAPGRIEAVAGRGSSDTTFPLFDLDASDYDMLYSSKLELLLALNANERVTWTGPHRRQPLEDRLVVPRPEQPLKIWLGTGGSPNSVMRAVELGLPMFLGILGGTAEHWAQYGHAYRAAWVQAGHPSENADIAVSHLGSGAVIAQRRLEDALGGRDTPDDFAPGVWDTWNAKNPEAQRDDGLAADAALLARLEAIPPEDRDRFTSAMGPMTFGFAEFVGMRLNEHAFHTWDIEVVTDPAATIPVPVADLVVDNLELVARFTSQPTGDATSVTVVTTDPRRGFTIELTPDGVAFAPNAAATSADLELPAGAFARLVYGRLDARNTPTGCDGPVADILRRVFPGP
jgi:alkanesulfonate monooxygenase SsuD/methylene tetrahydromethanopterin reductase-like flavin-dependent oxidoreductase (luciferase family)